MTTSPAQRYPTAELFDAAIFDLDGTLLDSLRDLAETANACLAARRLPLLPLACYRDLVGSGIPELCRRMLAMSRWVAAAGGLPDDRLFDAETGLIRPAVLAVVRSGQPETGADPPSASDLTRLIDDFSEHYDAHWQDHTRPFDGVLDLLAVLRGRGIRLALFSNKADLFVRAISDRYFGSGLFDIVIGQKPDQPLKPSPAVPLAIAAAWQIPPACVCMVGDSDVDMATARAAGMYPVAVSWGFRSRDELIRAGAGMMAERPSDLLQLFMED